MVCYDYRYVSNLPLNNEPEEILARMLYSFRSSQTNQTYWVIVDKCENDIFVVKFHLKAHRHSENKYCILTNLHEARSVVYTCLMIIKDEIGAKHPSASIGFVGASLEGESERNNKRFRFYSKFVQTHIDLYTYEHFANEEKSAYILIPRKALDINPTLPDIYLEMLENYEEHDSL